jgi:hypothetical protein
MPRPRNSFERAPQVKSIRIAAIGAALVAAFAMASAGAQEQGHLWETTSQAEIEGSPMKMPAISGKHCAKQDWAEAPPAGDPSQHCQNKDVNRSGNKLTWSVVCENPPMSGDGELTFDGDDSYTGFLNFNTGDLKMRVAMTGRKVGVCDNPQ